LEGDINKMKCEECTNCDTDKSKYGFTFCLKALMRETKVEWNETTGEYDCDKFNQKECK